MTFDLISELTRWTARLSMIFFAAAFLYEALRNGHPVTRRLWQGFAAMQGLYFLCLISYHLIIQQLPPLDLVNGLLIIATIMLCVILGRIWKKDVEKNRLFAPAVPSYYLALLLTALPISRILPPETDAPIYHVMLYAMIGVVALRIILDFNAAFKRRAASK